MPPPQNWVTHLCWLTFFGGVFLSTRQIGDLHKRVSSLESELARPRPTFLINNEKDKEKIHGVINTLFEEKLKSDRALEKVRAFLHFPELAISVLKRNCNLTMKAIGIWYIGTEVYECFCVVPHLLYWRRCCGYK